MDNHNDMRHDDGKNSRLDWRMHGSPIGGKSDYSTFL